jgi:orotate phosphoribosyltransferase-like protein
MKNLTFEHKISPIRWRRSKVVELRSRGLSYQDIAHELQVSKASIISDVQYLRKQAKGTMKEYNNDSNDNNNIQITTGRQTVF